MHPHRVSFRYLSQEDLLQAGCFDIRMAMEVAEKAMLAFEDQRILFPEKIVQIFNQASQERINCLPATLLDEQVCGVKWVSVFPHNPERHGVQNLSAIFVSVGDRTRLPDRGDGGHAGIQYAGRGHGRHRRQAPGAPGQPKRSASSVPASRPRCTCCR